MSDEANRDPKGWRKSRFGLGEDSSVGPLANLVDIMLVFACGLITAVVADPAGLAGRREAPREEVRTGEELPDVPEGVREAGSGYEAIGHVYRDPETGKMYLIEER